MKISEIFPTFDIFKSLVLNIINQDFNNPFWNDDTKNYTKNETIYNSLIRFFNKREATCTEETIDNWISMFIINYQEQKPFLYKRQQIFFEDNIKLLQKTENWGQNTDNSGGITTTRENTNQTKNHLDSIGNTFTAGQDIQSTFKKYSDDDPLTERTKNTIDSDSTLTQNGNEKTTNENNLSINDYNINQALEDINQRVVVLGLQDFLKTFNQFFNPWKLFFTSSIFC